MHASKFAKQVLGTAVSAALLAMTATATAAATGTAADGKIQWTTEDNTNYSATATEGDVYVGYQPTNGNAGLNWTLSGTGAENITFKGDKTQQFSLGAYGDYKIDKVGDITLTGEWAGDGTVFYTNTNGKMTINAGSIKTNNVDSGTIVFHAMGGTFDVNVGSLNLEGVGNGVFAQSSGAGAASTVNLNATGDVVISSTGVAIGAAKLSNDASLESHVSVMAKNISLTSSGSTTLSAYGQDWQTSAAIANSNSVTLTAEDNITIVNSSGKTAIRAKNGVELADGKAAGVTVAAKTIDVKGDIVAENNGTVSIGENEGFVSSTIVGNINTKGNVDVFVSLGDKGSFTGAVNQEKAEGSTAPGVEIDLGSQSVWNVSAASVVDTLSGTGSALLADKETKLAVGEVTGGDLTVGFQSLTADDFTDFEKEVKEIVTIDKVADDATAVIKAEEGDVKGETTVTIDKNGTTSESAVNTKLSALSSTTGITTAMWRHETNDLTKRMGELRDSADGIGTWARVYGSKQSLNAASLKSHSVQAGADVTVGEWIVGGAFSYTDGSSEYVNGSGDTQSCSVAAYGSWMAENGLFLDLIGKYSRLENDFEIQNMAGSLDNNAWSFSAELGWRLDLNESFYVEPQAELTYGFIKGDTTVTSNKVRIEQDDTDSLVGRLGIRAGAKFPEKKGNVYVRASVLHDFQGETSAVYSNDKAVETIEEDLGGTWYELGLGANFNLTPSTYVYVDLERSNAGKVVEDWRYNVGVRHVF